MTVDPGALDTGDVRRLLTGARWFSGKDRGLRDARVASVPVVSGALALALVEVAYEGGSSELYQLALATDGAEPGDALARPDLVAELCRLADVDTPARTIRRIEVEQSNTSVVVDERHVLKLLRRIEAGRNPEIELLGALARRGFAAVPRLEGAIEVVTPFPVALAALTAFVPSAGDGWNLALDSLGSDPGWLPERAPRLGAITAGLHAALAADRDLSTRPPVGDELVRLAAEVVAGLGGLDAAEICAELAVAELQALATELGRKARPTTLARVHGDFHLGQVLWADTGDWVVIDLEGEPGRSLEERRRHRSVVRDIAGMTRSFAYVADGARMLRGAGVPEGWLEACRAGFLDGYLDGADPRLVPPDRRELEHVLALFELERIVYELRYELGHRPDWIPIPLAGARRLLERGA